MIHPIDAPVFGDLKPIDLSESRRIQQRRHSWSTRGGEEETCPIPRSPPVSAELGNVLWGELFQAVTDRVFPTKTVEDALEVLEDSVREGSAGNCGSPADRSRRFSDCVKQISLKLVEAHMTNKSADVICACTGHQSESETGHRHSIIDQPKVLLLRRDETYDLVLSFDRDVSPDLDVVDIVLESEDHMIVIPGFNVIAFPVTASPPDAATSPQAFRHWWASYVTLEPKRATVRLHVSHSARVGKWRMKVLTGLKHVDPSKKNERDMSVAFHRLHIAMDPGQIGQKDQSDTRKKSLHFSKSTFTSKEA